MVYIFFQVTGFDFLHIFASTYFLFYNGGLVSKLYLTLATPWTIACQALLSMVTNMSKVMGSSKKHQVRVEDCVLSRSRSRQTSSLRKSLAS